MITGITIESILWFLGGLKDMTKKTYKSNSNRIYFSFL
jgi:hypothetical protein